MYSFDVLLKLRLVKLYLTSLGGGHTILFWFMVLFLLAMAEVIGIIQTWFLGYWSSQYNDQPTSEVDVK